MHTGACLIPLKVEQQQHSSITHFYIIFNLHSYECSLKSNVDATTAQHGFHLVIKYICASYIGTQFGFWCSLLLYLSPHAQMKFIYMFFSVLVSNLPQLFGLCHYTYIFIAFNFVQFWSFCYKLSCTQYFYTLRM